MSKSRHDVAVIGGAGHVGVPLSLVLASRGLQTLIVDVDRNALALLQAGRLPFLEEGAEALLRSALDDDKLAFSTTPEGVAGVPTVIVTIGTPIDEFQNPNLSVLTRCLDELLPHLSDEQTLILRSTVAPGTTSFVANYLRQRGRKTRLSFCPERVVQGKGVVEIQELPQLVSGVTPEALEAATKFFSAVGLETVEMTPLEAEFGKLICNAYRYIQFAATNQLYMMVEAEGLDYNEILRKIKKGYPRMTGVPGPGFAAGPCLMKDTVQLFAFQKHRFILGQVAMTINEGLPNYIVERIAAQLDLEKTRVGILGMAFKADSDDIRDSLSYKLVKLLRYHGARVVCSDEHVKDSAFVSKEELIASSDLVIIGVPHAAYARLTVPPSVELVDLWRIVEREGRRERSAEARVAPTAPSHSGSC